MIPKERYHKIKELFQQATKLTKTEQGRFLEQISVESPSLVKELEGLLITPEEQPQFDQIPENVGKLINTLLFPHDVANPSFAANRSLDDFTIPANKQKPSLSNYLLKKGDMVNHRYQIEQEFQRGGFAIVYLAKDISLHNRPIILKILNKVDSNATNWLKNKFLAEIKALSKLHHPNIVTIFDYGVLADNKPFFVMEYIQGYSLRQLISKTSLGLMSEQAANIIHQISNALDNAHSLGIYHRDLKPENIMVQALNNEQLHIKVIDFGIATVKDSATVATNTSSIAGTPTYMAPEQLEGKPSAASDLYALGIIAYELLTGRPPFNISHFKDIRQAVSSLKQMQKQGLIVTASQLNPSLPAAVDKVLLKALAYNAKNRYKQATLFAKALDKALLSLNPDTSYWEKLCSLAQPTENIKVISQDSREKLKLNSQLARSFTQYNYPLNSRLSILLDIKQAGHLLLIAKDVAESGGLAYCLCPSHFAASDKLSDGLLLLPTEGLVYNYFPLAERTGKKQLLAIVSHSPLELAWESSLRMPAQILTTKDLYTLLVKLQQLPTHKWAAFSTIINIA